MPISKDKAALYPTNWKELSRWIREERARGRCECTGECGAGHFDRCTSRNGGVNVRTGSRVVLTCAHLDHDPTGDDPALIKAMCQQCHLALDRDQHRASAADSRSRKADAAAGQGRLFR